MALITSAGTGLFNAGATWNGGVVPTAPNTAVVQNGHTVTIDASATLGPDTGGLDPSPETDCSFIVRGGGTLILPSSAAADYTWTLQGPIKIEADGTFQVGDSFASPFPSTRVFQIAFSAYAYENWIAGNFRLYGCTGYHMASATSQRTRLNADVVAGAGQTFTVEDSVDWSINDIIMVGTGGDPAHAATGCELVQITDKTNATTYEATFVSNHFGDANFGDVLIHATRNIIISGTDTKGFSLVTTTNGSTGSRDTVDLDINWCRFNYAGTGTGAKESAISLYEDNPSGDKKFLNDIKLRGNVFVNSATTSSYQIGLYYAVIQQEDRTLFAENHAYNTPGIIFANQSATGGHIVMGALSCMQAIDIGVNNANATILFDIEDFTYVCDTNWNNSSRTAIKQRPVVLNKFKIHRCYRGLELNTPVLYYGSAGGALYRVFNGEIFSSYNTGIYMGGSSNFCPHWIFKNINLRRHEGPGLTIYGYVGRFAFMDCLIDDCAKGFFATGAVSLGVAFSDSDKALGITFINCKWGSVVANDKANMRQFTNPAYSRTIFQNCSWVVPTNISISDGGTWNYYIQEQSNDLIMWDGAGDAAECNQYRGQDGGNYSHAAGKVFENIIYFGDWGWSTRVAHTAFNSFEFINSLEPLSIVGTYNQGLVCGGGEIIKASGTYIDGTINRRLRPFFPVHRQHITKANPIKLALQSGEIITVSLSLKKNISQETYRLPKIHLFGCGISASATMSNVIATWEELTVSGTAQFSGIVDFWISCFAEPNLASYTGDPANPYDVNLYPRSRGTDTTSYFWMHQPCNPGGLGYAFYNANKPMCAPPSCSCYTGGSNCEKYSWDHFGPGCPFPNAGPTLSLELQVDGLEVDIS